MNKSSPRYRYARRLWSEAVRSLFNHKCFLCGRVETDSRPHAAHHIIPARNKWSEFDLLNGVPLCSLPDGRSQTCHGKVHDTPEGKTELDARMAQFPGWAELLHSLRNYDRGSFSKSDLEDAIEFLENDLSEGSNEG